MFQDESEKTATDSCFAFKEVQVHGTFKQIHQGVLQSGLSFGAQII